MNFKEQSVQLPVSNFDNIVEQEKRRSGMETYLQAALEVYFVDRQIVEKPIVYLHSLHIPMVLDLRKFMHIQRL